MPDADEEPREPTPVEQLPPPKPAELKEEVTVQGGRRRGKRQVMKKKTVKDEEGYLGSCIPVRPFVWRGILIRCSYPGRGDVGVFLRG
jgi:DNA polymerase subunit Cdc27.